MAANAPLDLVRKLLGELAQRIVVRRPQRIYVDVPPEHTLRANRLVFEQLGGRLATASGVDQRDRIEVLYHYCLDAHGVIVTLRTWALKPDLRLDSVAQFLPAAAWAEREMQDLLGVVFVDHPDPRRLILADEWPEGVFPLRRDFPARKGTASPPSPLSMCGGGAGGEAAAAEPGPRPPEGKPAAAGQPPALRSPTQ